MRDVKTSAGGRTLSMKLDYSLKTPEERKALVEQIVAEANYLSPKYLEILADYLVIPIERQERKEHKLLTDNRMTTINKREVSLEGLISQLENGEDGIYNLAQQPSKATIFQPKIQITKQDIAEIPFLSQLRDSITRWEIALKHSSGRAAYIIKRTLIEMRKDQYIIKNAYKKPVNAFKVIRTRPTLSLPDSYSFDPDGTLIPSGFSLADPHICQLILLNYSKLKQDSYDNFESDTRFLLQDFDDVAAVALADSPFLQRLMTLKIDGLSNQEIQEILLTEFGKRHSLEYLSSLWRNKIPKLIADVAAEQLLQWHYLTVEKGHYKKCNRCGQIKLAHGRYFSKNSTSRDHFYSICKECRSRKGR